MAEGETNSTLAPKHASETGKLLGADAGSAPFPHESVLSGVFTVAIPATYDDGTLDEAGLCAFVDEMLEFDGISGITCLSSQGEFAYLSEAERKKVAELVVKTVNGRCPVLVGVHAIATKEAIAFGRHALDIGASGVMITPQSYIPLNTDQVVHHFETFAAAVPLPIRAYNSPATTQFDLTPDVLARLSEIDTVTSVKESSGDSRRVQEIALATRDRPVAVFNGLHSTAAASFYLGAAGWDITMSPQIAPHCLELYEAAVINRDPEAAREKSEHLLPLFHFLKTHGVNRTLRAIGDLTGRPLGPPRGPLLPIGQEPRKDLARILSELAIATTERPWR